MSETRNLHAGLVAIGGRGHLIVGPARSGKSALAVSLIRAAAREGLPAALVADDRTLVRRESDVLLGRAPETIAGLLELSGIGILRLPHEDETAISVVVELDAEGERLPDPQTFDLLGLRVPRVRVPPRQAPFAADLLVTLHLATATSLLKP